MITWLQTAALKHNKIIFGALMVVIIVTFVLYVGPQGFGGSDRGMQIERRDFYGINLNNQNDQQRMMQNSTISAQLNVQLGINSQTIGQYAFARTAALGLANQMDIPEPKAEGLDRFIREMEIFQDPSNGQFSASTYNEVLEFLKSNFRVTEAQVARVLREDYQVSRVLDVLSGPAFVLPFEARQNFIDTKTVWDVILARYSYADFQPELSPDQEALQRFYENNLFRYRIAERISVTAVQFQAVNFISRLSEPSSEELQSYFDRFSFRYQPAPTEEEEQEPATLADTDVLQRVTADWKHERATRLAREASDAFLGRMWESRVSRGSPEVQQIAADFGGVLRQVAPYSREEQAFDPAIPQSIRRNAWIFIDGDRFYTDIGQTRDGATVLLVNEVLPATTPSFEEISDRVTADWKSQERRRLFVDAGATKRADLLAAMEYEGVSFSEAAASLNLEVADLAPFQGDAVPPTLANSVVWSQIRTLREGNVSEMVVEADKGTFAYVVTRARPEIDFSDEEVISEMDAVQAFQRSTAGWMVVSELANAKLAALGEFTE